MSIDRLRRVKSLMEQEGFEALFVSPGPNQRYLTGLRYDYPGDAWDVMITWDIITFAVIPLDGDPVLVVPRIGEEDARELSKLEDIRPYSSPEDRKTVLGELLSNMKGTIGTEDHMPFKTYEQLTSAVPDVTVRSASDMLSLARLVKSEEEIECVRKAARIVEDGVKVGREFIRESATEREISIEVERAMRARGAESISYCVVQTGAKTATWDPPSEDRVKKGDMFLMDLSATYNGYHADLTRPTVVGEPSEKQKRVHEVVHDAQLKAIEAVRDGVRAGAVNDAARKVIDESGYGEHFPFGIGHGLGLEAHEMPHLTEYKDTEMTLKPGIVMTIEPTLNFPGEFGIRIEDDILVTLEGSEHLTRFGKDLTVV
ncbi:MAG: aminopeptidase P family protein [Methanobacteriota archaeon]|nr:MAG: aminopeptidase P family protein [Euryarchaeota archaeon]